MTYFGPTIAFVLALGLSPGHAQTTNRPPAIVELPYRSEIHWGDGYDLNVNDFAAHPFDLSTEPETVQESASEQLEFFREVATSTKEIADKMRLTGVVDTSGWDPYMKLGAFYDNQFEFKSTDAMFIIKADKQYGFEGWRSPPPFTETAKNILCKQESGVHGKEIDYDAFSRIYGTHYVTGQRMAANFNVFMKLSTTTTNKTKKVSAQLDLAFNLVGAITLNTTVNFTRALTNNEAGSRLQIWASAQGVSRTFIPDATPDTVHQQIKEWNEQSTVGTGIAHVLRRYEDHPDFVEALTTCVDSREVELSDDSWKNMLIDAAIHAKLMGDEMMGRDPSHCAWRLSEQAFEQFDLILALKDSEHNRGNALEATRNVTSIEDLWNPDGNKCVIDEMYCKYSNWVSEGRVHARDMTLEAAKSLCGLIPTCKAVTCDFNGRCSLRGTDTLTPSMHEDTTYVLATECHDSRDRWEHGTCNNFDNAACPTNGDLGFQDTKEDCLGKCQAYDRWMACQYNARQKDRTQSNCIRHTCLMTNAQGGVDSGSLCILRSHSSASHSHVHSSGYINSLDKEFTKTFGEKTVMSGLSAQHSNWHEDRHYKVYSKELPGIEMTPRAWVRTNGYTASNFRFDCGDNEAMIGIGSKHSNYYEDREWRMRCADLGRNSKYFVHSANGQNCRTLGPLNNFDGDFDGQCESNEVLSGLQAEWSGWHADRRWWISCCKIVKIDDVPVASTQMTVPNTVIPAPTAGLCHFRIELSFRELQLCPHALMYGIGVWFEVAKGTQTCEQGAKSFATELYNECLKDDDLLAALVDVDRVRSDAYEIVRASLVFTGSPTSSPVEAPVDAPVGAAGGFFSGFGMGTMGGGTASGGDSNTVEDDELPPLKEQPWAATQCSAEKNKANGLNKKCKFAGKCEQRGDQSGCACCDPTSVGNWCYGNPEFDGCVPDVMDTRSVCPRLNCPYRKVEQVECKASRIMRYKEKKDKMVPLKYVSYEKAKMKCDKLGPKCVGVYDKNCDGEGFYFLCAQRGDLMLDGKSCVWEK